MAIEKVSPVARPSEYAAEPQIASISTSILTQRHIVPITDNVTTFHIEGLGFSDSSCFCFFDDWFIF